jgi:hypothetical protein
MVDDNEQSLWGDLKMSPSKAQPLELPNDPRFEHRNEKVNGVNYHYIFAEPKNDKVRATVVLVSTSP